MRSLRSGVNKAHLEHGFGVKNVQMKRMFLFASLLLGALLLSQAKLLLASALVNQHALQTLVGYHQEYLYWPDPSCGASPSLHIPSDSSQFDKWLLSGMNRASLIWGRSLWLAGNCDGAVAAIGDSINHSTGVGNDLARLEMGRMLISVGKEAEATRVFQLAHVANFIQHQAESAQQRGDLSEAKVLFELTMRVQPFPATADALSSLYVQTGQPEAAIVVWQRMANTVDDDHALHWLALSKIAELNEDWTGANAYLERAIVFSTQPFDLYLRLGRLRSNMHDWKGVVEASEEAVGIKPGVFSEPYTLAARAEIEMGDFEAAIWWADQALRSRIQGDPWPDILAAEAYDKLGKPEEAKLRYLAALDQAPNHFAATLYLSQLEHRMGELEQAVMRLEQIAQPENCQILPVLLQWNSELESSSRIGNISDFVVQCDRQK